MEVGWGVGRSDQIEMIYVRTRVRACVSNLRGPSVSTELDLR